LCNLFENAGKYAMPGSRIDISAVVQGSSAALTVADDGPGVAPGREEEMFEKFTRGERETVRNGVGLGLAICRAIVEAHGGKIGYAHSAFGGAAFIVTLPLGQAPSTTELETDTGNSL
jgi:two-component system sensor histidine kinase KdpD